MFPVLVDTMFFVVVVVALALYLVLCVLLVFGYYDFGLLVNFLP